MDYYRCPRSDLCRELQRRGCNADGSNDQLSESLKRDDETRESIATTVRTANFGHFVPKHLDKQHRSRLSAQAKALIGEKITYWTMNAFFPTLHLFFESGRSCIISSEPCLSEQKACPNIRVGLDPELKFRLTDCSHQEDGQAIMGTAPAKFSEFQNGLYVQEVAVARRTSVSTLPMQVRSSTHLPSPSLPASRIVENEHVVVGLRLKGMSELGYVWAKSEVSQVTWIGVQIGDVRTDVPAPALGLPASLMKPGGQMTIFVEESMIRDPNIKEEEEE